LAGKSCIGGIVTEKITMTLLVPRKKIENAPYPYAVQIVVPKGQTPGMRTSLTSVRLIHQSGSRATGLETMDTYRPNEWRAAALSEQSQYAIEFRGNPKPWFCFMYSLTTSVYDYRGAGDKNSNNGQQWLEIENLDKEWEAEREMRNNHEEVLAAEWNRRIAKWGEND
jgi:hypothetical protein